MSIPERNITEKRRFEALGGVFIMATGRSVDSPRLLAKQLEVKTPSIHHNGASIYDYSQEKYIAASPILRSEVAEFFAELMQWYPDVGLEVSCVGQHFLLAPGEIAYQHASQEFDYEKSDIAGTPPEWLKGLVSGHPDKVEAVFRFGLEKAPKTIRTVKSSEWFCEFISADVDKFSAAKKVMEMMGQPLEKSCGIGDFFNDYELFTQTAIGAVPASAPDEVKNLAPLIVCSCEDGALADFILHIEGLIDRISSNSECGNRNQKL